jgi:hypothetical protein
MMKAELQDVALKAGEDWDKYRAKIENFLVDWEKHNTALLRYTSPPTGAGGHIQEERTLPHLISLQSVGCRSDGRNGAA